MKKLVSIATTGLLAMSMSSVFAGALDRAAFNTDFLFQDRNYFETIVTHTTPEVSDARTRSEIADSFRTLIIGAKYQVTDTFTLALRYTNQSIGSDINYSGTTLGRALGNPRAYVSGDAIWALGKYSFSVGSHGPNGPAGRFSLFGGVKYQQLSGSAGLAPLAAQGAFIAASADTFEKQREVGGVVGIAYEIPRYRVRAILTYESRIEYSLNTLTATGASIGETNAATPETWLFEFQTGIPPEILHNTSLVGSVRHARWDNANIFIPNGPTTVPLTAFNSITRYEVGLGHIFGSPIKRPSDMANRVGAIVSVFYEPADDEQASLLAPRDGVLGARLLSFMMLSGGLKLSGSITYSKLGDADTVAGPFKDNSVWAFGFKVSRNF